LDERANVSRVRKLVMESNGYLTLGPQETAALKRLLSERSSSGVFVQGQFTTGDASALGLEIDPDEGGGGSGGEQQLQNQSQAEYENGMLPAALALVAPDLTPGHSSPISTSEAQRVIGVQAPPAAPAPAPAPAPSQTAPAPTPAPQPAPMPQSTAESRAMAMLNMGSLAGGPAPGPLNESGFVPLDAGEGDVNIMARNLAEARRKKNQKEQKRHGGGGHAPSNEEARRLAAAASSKLARL